MALADDDRTLQTAHGLRRNGKFSEAANLYRKLIRKKSDNFHALHFLGVAEAGRGNFAQARVHVERSLSVLPPNIQFIENCATIQFQAGDYKAALETCRKGLELFGSSVALLYVSALSYLKLGDAQESLAQFDKLLALEPRHIAAFIDRAAVLAALKQYDAALGSLERAISLDLRCAEAYLNKAALCGQLGRYDEAVIAYDKALALKPGLASAWVGRGNVLYNINRCEEAVVAYDRALALQLDCVDAWVGRGNALFGLLRLDEALGSYDRAIALQPDTMTAWVGRGNVFGLRKEHERALTAYDRALGFNGHVAETWLGRGNVLRELGRHDEALVAYDRSLTLKSDLPGAWLGRGNVFCELKCHDQALDAFDRALAKNPALADAWLGRGNVLGELRRYSGALAAYNEALLCNAEYAEAWLGRGNVLDMIRHHSEGLAAYDKALELKPELASAWFGRANMYSEFRRYDEALEAYNRALALRPGFAEVWFGRGRTYSRMGRHDDAIAAQDQALALKPDFPEALLGRAIACLETNRESEALANLDRALAIRPNFEPAISYRIFVLDFTPGVGIEEQQEARRHWWRQVGAKLAAQSESHHTNSRDPDRRIRLGYVSGDFRFHSAALFYRPVLLNHDKSRFEITCYYTSNEEDEYTDNFRKSADRWRDAAQLSDEELSERIKADEIDILVDLSGHTAGDRLAAFARKPAPIQVSAGATGTGLPTMDYLLSHPVICPAAVRPFFAEKIVDMPSVMTIVPLPQHLGPTDPPVLTHGYLTFGVFNRATKVSDDMIALWARILNAVPQSRIMLKHYGFGEPSKRDRMLEKFVSRGIASDRITFVGATTRGEHLAAFKDVDISLDPFPHNGGISTLESLQMGVPVVAMLGEGIASRAAGAILSSIDLNDWVSQTPEGYLAIAKKFAAMPDYLKVLRYSIPARLAGCATGNPGIYTKALEAVYQKMWADYCRPAV